MHNLPVSLEDRIPGGINGKFTGGVNGDEVAVHEVRNIISEDLKGTGLVAG